MVMEVTRGKIMVMEVTRGKIEMKVSAKQMWKAVTEEAVSIMPKAAGEVIEKVEDEGDSLQAGAIRTIHFQKSFVEKKAKEKKSNRLILYTKEKLIEINPHARTFTAQVIEGGFFGELLKKHYVSMFFEETGPNTSVLHYTFDYEPISDQHNAHIPHTLKEGFTKIMCAAEAFLVSHQD